MSRDDRTEIKRKTHTHVLGSYGQRGTRSSVDEGSPIRVVADLFGDRCSTGERLLPARPYDGGAQPHTCRHGVARTWGPARRTHTREHAAQSRSRRECTRVKTSLEWRAAPRCASRAIESTSDESRFYSEVPVPMRPVATCRSLVGKRNETGSDIIIFYPDDGSRIYILRTCGMFARKRLDQNYSQHVIYLLTYV